MTRLSFAWLAAFAALFIGLFAGALSALEVQPLRFTLEPERGQTSTSFVVANPRAEPLPFEVRMERRLIAEDGTQTFEPADEEFIVFPVQGLLQPGATQAVRVQYVGDIDLEETAGYIVRFAEVPVLDPNISGIQFAYTFGAALYVKPAGAEANIVVDEAVSEGGRLTMSLRNTGNDFIVLTRDSLRFRIGEENFRFAPDDLRELISDSLVAPYASRTLVLDIPDLPPGTVTQVTFD